MECAKSKELLSEYIDGMLDLESEKLLEEHLSSCEGCKEELISLKVLVKELGSLEPVETPVDFLDRLHERLEPSFKFGKILRMLFVPPRIKIPLEFAAVAAMAILVFSILHIQRQNNQVADVPGISAPVRIAKKPMAEALTPEITKETYKPKPAFQADTARPPKRERKTIELALLLKPEAPGRAYAPSSAMDAAPAPAKEGKILEEELAREIDSSGTGISRRAAPRVGIKRDWIEEKKPALELPKAEHRKFYDEGGISFSSLQDMLSEVKNLIGLAEGKVISIEYDKQTERPQTISAEIPAKNFNSFYEKLKRLAVLQTPPPAVSEKNQQAVPIRIRFIFSE